jgi:hypothetical protein
MGPRHADTACASVSLLAGIRGVHRIPTEPEFRLSSVSVCAGGTRQTCRVFNVFDRWPADMPAHGDELDYRESHTRSED